MLNLHLVTPQRSGAESQCTRWKPFIRYLVSAVKSSVVLPTSSEECSDLQRWFDPCPGWAETRPVCARFRFINLPLPFSPTELKVSPELYRTSSDPPSVLLPIKVSTEFKCFMSPTTEETHSWTSEAHSLFCVVLQHQNRVSGHSWHR